MESVLKSSRLLPAKPSSCQTSTIVVSMRCRNVILLRLVYAALLGAHLGGHRDISNGLPSLSNIRSGGDCASKQTMTVFCAAKSLSPPKKRPALSGEAPVPKMKPADVVSPSTPTKCSSIEQLQSAAKHGDHSRL